jgi:hypothetical protein
MFIPVGSPGPDPFFGFTKIFPSLSLKRSYFEFGFKSCGSVPCCCNFLISPGLYHLSWTKRDVALCLGKPMGAITFCLHVKALFPLFVPLFRVTDRRTSALQNRRLGLQRTRPKLTWRSSPARGGCQTRRYGRRQCHPRRPARCRPACKSGWRCTRSPSATCRPQPGDRAS